MFISEFALSGHDIKIEIVLKNDYSIETLFPLGQEDMGLLENPSGVEKISNGLDLLHALADWSPHIKKNYVNNGNRWTCENNREILSLEDFTYVKKIVITDFLSYVLGRYEKGKTLTISSKNNPYITKDNVLEKPDLKNKKINIPESVEKIEENAFLGCSRLTAFVREGQLDEKMLKKMRCEYYEIPVV